MSKKNCTGINLNGNKKRGSIPKISVNLNLQKFSTLQFIFVRMAAY